MEAWLRMRIGNASSPSRAGSRLLTIVWTLVMAYSLGRTWSRPADAAVRANLAVQKVRLTDNGDNDGFADPHETVQST